MKLRIGVRALAEAVCREGGLSPLTFGGLDGPTGTRLHQIFYRHLECFFPEASSSYEQSLAREYLMEEISIHLHGRVDALLHFADGQQEVVEVKTYSSTGRFQPDGEQSEHRAQALLYTCLLENPQPQGHRQFRYHLAYLAPEQNEPLIYTFSIAEVEAYAWLQEVLRRFLHQIQADEIYRQRRDQSIRELRFPYKELRPGQRLFMEKVLRALQSQTALLIQAPTGTGKTLSTLYPAIKALPTRMGRQIFYLTAKVATRKVAEETLLFLQDKGLFLRFLTLKAKEKLCPVPELYCDPSLCPYAVHYYKNLPAALTEAKQLLHLEETALLELAQRHQVCPYELSLDIASSCDIVLGDYNHFFNPRVRLQRFFNHEGEGRCLLIDEAHNLVDRSREMYSASLSLLTLHQAMEQVKIYSLRLEEKFKVLLDYYAHLAKALKKDEPGFDQVEKAIQAEEVFSAPAFRATQKPLPGLRRFLFSMLPLLRDVLQNVQDPPQRRPILDFYFELLYFLRVLDEFWDEAYLACFKREKKDILLELRCLDASNKLAASYGEEHVPLFFSATLSPMDYFASSFFGEEKKRELDQLSLVSPFPKEHLCLIIYDQLRMRYLEREQSKWEAASLIAEATSLRRGNYLVFFPSYRYLEEVASCLPSFFSQKSGHKIHLLKQTPGMSDADQAQFLTAFDQVDPEMTKIGLAVLGGSFSEGIDLRGERLSGVIILGVGLPSLRPEQELLRQYYDSKGKPGFQFAYTYPGFTKIQQAAGRLIRSETDLGFILLCDVRYAEPGYQALMPEHWHPHLLSSRADVIDTLEAFYLDYGLLEKERENEEETPTR